MQITNNGTYAAFVPTKVMEKPSAANNYGMTAEELAAFRASHNGMSPLEIERVGVGREIMRRIPDRMFFGASAWHFFQRQGDNRGPDATLTVTVLQASFKGGPPPGPPTTHTFTVDEARRAYEAMPGVRKQVILDMKAEAEEGSLKMWVIKEKLAEMYGTAPSGSLPPADATPQGAHIFIDPQSVEYEDYFDMSLAQAFADAISEFKTRFLRGNALTEEEIQERLDAFKEKFAPEEPASELELADFQKKLDAYEKHLREIGTNHRTEMLVFSLLEKTDDDGKISFMRSRIQSNPGLQNLLQG